MVSLRQRQEAAPGAGPAPVTAAMPTVRAAELLRALLRNYLFWLGVMMIVLGFGLITAGTVLGTYTLAIFSDLFTAGVIGIPLTLLGLVLQMLGWAFIMSATLVELKRLRALRASLASTEFV